MKFAAPATPVLGMILALGSNHAGGRDLLLLSANDADAKQAALDIPKPVRKAVGAEGLKTTADASVRSGVARADIKLRVTAK